MTSMKLNQSDPDPPKRLQDWRGRHYYKHCNQNKKSKERERKINKRVNYESEKLQHCHVAVVTGGTSGSGWIVDAVALRFAVCRCWGRRCAGRDAARWWFESVPTRPPFPEADYAVLAGAASCDSLLDVLLDTRRRSVRIADRLHPQTTTKKQDPKNIKQNQIHSFWFETLSISSYQVLTCWQWIVGWVW